MNRVESVIGRISRPAGFLALGALGTAALALAAGALLAPLDRWAYHALYPPLGPGRATRVATLGSYTLVVAVAFAPPVLLGASLADRPIRTPAYWKIAVVQLAVIGLAPVAAATHSLAVVALAVLDVVLLAVLVVLWYRADVRSDVPAVLVGAMAVLVPLVLFSMFVPLGWTAHTVVATEVPEADVAGAEVVDVGEASPLRDAVFTGCDEGDGAMRTCRTGLSGDGPSRRIVASLDRHGVRCPYEEGVSTSSLVVEHDGSYYRVTCETRGV